MSILKRIRIGMEILEFGNKQNKKIVLIHGFESPHQIWEKYISHYQKDFHVIVPILTGHNPKYKEDFETFDKCVKEFEDFYIKQWGNKVYAVYGMSMGGVFASHIWKNGNIQIEKLIMESSPLLSYGRLITSVLIKQYLKITHKAQQGDEKTLRRAAGSMVTEEQLDVFMDLLSNITDTTITNYITEVGKFKLPANIDSQDMQIVYYYGGKINEIIFKQTAKYIKKNYPKSKIISFPGKGHCQDALLHPDIRIKELDSILKDS